MDIDDLVAQLPLDQIAGQLGVDQSQAADASKQAVTALVGGLEANAQDPGGLSSLESALQQHADQPAVTDISQVDTADGEKIIGHVFGDNKDAVVSQLGGLGGGSLIGKLLPMLAPMVLGLLANNVGKASAGSAGGGAGGGGLTDVLGGLLGGGGGGGGLGGLGDILGGLLGGGTKS